MRRAAGWLGVLGLALALAQSRPASAQHIENGKAVFAALDKVTARISRLEAELGKTVKFGALTLTPRACYSRAPTEPPKTTTFVEIDETQLDGKSQRIYSGWMFAESPGLSAVEHPVYDVWLTECTAPKRPAVVQAPHAGGGTRHDDAGGAAQPAPIRRSRPPR